MGMLASPGELPKKREATSLYRGLVKGFSVTIMGIYSE